MEFLILHMFVSIGIFEFGERQILLWFKVLISFAEKFEAVINLATGINETFYLIAGSDCDSSIIILEDLKTIKNTLNHMELSISSEFEGVENILLHSDTATIIQNWNVELSVGIQTVHETWKVFINYMIQLTSPNLIEIHIISRECQSEGIDHNMAEGCSSRGKFCQTKQLEISGTCYERMLKMSCRNFMSGDEDIDEDQFLDKCMLENEFQQYNCMEADDLPWNRSQDDCGLKEVFNFTDIEGNPVNPLSAAE